MYTFNTYKHQCYEFTNEILNQLATQVPDDSQIFF